MKKIALLLLSLSLILFLCSCSSTETTKVTETTKATETPHTTPAIEEVSISSIIKNAELQYPGFNEIFKYNVYDTYVEITEYIGGDGVEEIIVPCMLEDLPVYHIDSDVFDRCQAKSIVFEDGIYSISSGFSPFLISVTLPSTLEYVSNGMFEDCYSLETVVIPEGVGGIWGRAFKSCSALKEITIPSSVTSLDSEAFAFCTALETVNLPEGMVQIRDNAFGACESLKKIAIPSTVEELGSDVFLCSGLEYIELPENVKKIGDGLFTGCENLKTVKVYNDKLEIQPAEGYSFSRLFGQCNPDLVVHGKPASTIAKQCAQEDIFFEVIK